jgi:hypothetical protein
MFQELNLTRELRDKLKQFRYQESNLQSPSSLNSAKSSFRFDGYPNYKINNITVNPLFKIMWESEK